MEWPEGSVSYPMCNECEEGLTRKGSAWFCEDTKCCNFMLEISSGKIERNNLVAWSWKLTGDDIMFLKACNINPFAN